MYPLIAQLLGSTAASRQLASGGGITSTYFLTTAAAEQSVTDGPATTTLNFGTETYDPDALFASNVFTVPSTMNGAYAILIGSVQFKTSLSNSNSHALSIQLSTDGGTVWNNIVKQGSRTTFYHKCFTTVVLTTGHKYRVAFEAIDGVGRIVDDLQTSFFGSIILEPIA